MVASPNSSASQQQPQQPHNPTMELDTRPPPPLTPSGKEGQLAASPTSPALPFGLEKLKSPTSSPRELSVLVIFGDALRSNDPDVEDVSARPAVALNALCPPIDDTHDNYESSRAAEGFLWELWTLVLGIARVVPHDAEHPGQATIVGILDALRQLPRGTVTLWGSDMQLWRDLPLFVQRMADSSGRPRGDDLSEDAIRYWRNQNAFAARCLQAGLAGWDDDAVYALRDALEEQVDENDIDILAATEWVVHSSPKLLQRAQDSDEDHEDGTAYERDDDLPPGPLFSKQQPDARAGLSGARWAFWKQRFQALLQPAHVLAEDVRAAVTLAVERMERAETESTEQAAEQLRKWEMEIGAEEAEKEEKEEGDVSDVDDEKDGDDKSKDKVEKVEDKDTDKESLEGRE